MLNYERNTAFDFFTFVYDYVFIAQLIAVCLALLIVFYPLKKTVKSCLIALAHFIALFAANTLINWGLFALSQVFKPISGINFQLAYIISVIAYMFVVRKMPVMSRVIMGATLCVTIIAVCDLARQIMNFMPSDSEYINIIAYVLIIIYSLILHKFTLSNYRDIPLVSVIMILINTVSSAMLILVNTRIRVNAGNRGGDVYYALSLAVIYVVNVTGYMMIFFHCKVRKEMTELQVENKLLEADKQMLVVSEQAISEMRQMRHDIKNQYKVISLMVQEKKYEELEKYLNSMTETLLPLGGTSFIDCGNALINSVVNMEILKANKYGIQLITKINVPQELPFGHSDLCRILVNLLDNAIEGITRADNKKFLIDCKITRHAGYLYICVRNEIRDDSNIDKLLQLNTQKEDIVNHGFGHRIVKKIARKYNGFVSYSVEENNFIAEVMLDMGEKVESTDKTKQGEGNG